MKTEYTEEFIQQILTLTETMPVIKVSVLHNIRDVTIYRWMKQRGITPPCKRKRSEKSGEVVL